MISQFLCFRISWPRGLALVAWSCLAACGVRLDIDEGSEITCRADRDCPTTFVCDQDSGRCVSAGASAPSLSIVGVSDDEGTSRPQQRVRLRVVVRDRTPRDATTATLSAEFAPDCRGDGAGAIWRTATLSPGSGANDGTPFDVVWDAQADAAASATGLTLVLVDRDGDTTPETEVVGPCAAVTVRLRATDGDGLSSSWSETSPFPLGNDAPLLTEAYVLDDEARGNAVVGFAIADGSGDAVDLVDFQVSLIGDFSDAVAVPLERDHLPVGTFTAIAGAPGATVPVTVTWASDVLFPLDAAAVLRLRVRDSLGAYSSYAESAVFELDNANTAPTLELVDIAPGPFTVDLDGHATLASVATTAVAVTYQLDDADGDFPSLRAEVILDGATRQPALTTSILAALTLGEHLFVWNAAQAGANFVGPVELVLTPVDAETGVERRVSFGLDTRLNAPPRIVDAATAMARNVAAGPVAITYRLTDEAADPADLKVEFSTDGGGSWHACREYPSPLSEGTYALATAPAGLLGDGGVAHTFVWDATGVPRADLATVRLRARDRRDAGETTVELRLAATLGSSSTPWLPAVHTAAVTGANPRDLTVGDFNGDGALDVAVAESGLNQVALHLASLVGDAPDGSFAAPVSFAVGAQPWALVAADFNGDLKLDLAVANSSGDSISILLGTGSGDFTLPAPSYAVGDAPRALVAEDFNGDTVIDLAVAGYSSDDVSILIGAGNGSFASPVAYPAGNIWANGLVAGDFNGDGILDLVASEYAGLVMLVGRGSNGVGDGTFAAPTFLPGPTPAEMLRTADLDDDGVLDLMALGSGLTDGVLVYIGNQTAGLADGTFAEPEFYAVAGPRGLAIADLDGDGTADLAVGGNGTVSLLRGYPAAPAGARFAAAVSVPAGVTGSARAPQAADIDGDGLVDLVTALDGTTTDGFSVLLTGARRGVGGVAFEPVVSLPAHKGARAVYTPDLDADGIADLVTGSMGVLVAGGRGVSGVGDGSYLAPVELLPFGSRVVRSTVADVNADGTPDVIAVMERIPFVGTEDTAVVWLSSGPAGLGGHGLGIVSSLGVTTTPSKLATADFDADGLVDFALTDETSPGRVLVFFGSGSDGVGDGGFGRMVAIAVGNSPSGVLARDFNGDGAADLAVANRQAASSSVSIVLGNTTAGVPDGTFGSAAFVPLGATPEAIIVSDFNDDGILDLATANTSGSVSILVGNGVAGVGDGTFTAGSPLAVSPGPYDLVAADADGDGLTDLLVAHGSGEMVSVLRGLGTGGIADGSFAAGVVGAALPGIGVRALTAFDIDRNGVVDLALCGSGFTTLVLMGSYDGGTAWTRPLVAHDPTNPASGVFAYGFTPVVTAVADAFGRPYRSPRLGVHVERSADPLVLGARPVTHAYRIVGDRRLSRRPAPGPGGVRLRVDAALGDFIAGAPGCAPSCDPGNDDARLGLDLSASAAPGPRGVVVDLPILAGRSNAELAGKTIEVRLESMDWLRADVFACVGPPPPDEGTPCDPLTPPELCDPFAADPIAAAYLPRLPSCAYDSLRETYRLAYRDVLREQVVILPVQLTTDLANGQGPRFVVETDLAGTRRIRLLTDRLGLAQALLRP